MNPIRRILLLLAAIAAGVSCAVPKAGPTSPAVRAPRLWTDEALEGWATPVAGLGVPPGYVSENVYYAAPIDNLRTYPVYLPGREPAGYLEHLRSIGPKRLIEPESLRTSEDWIEAGRRVFEELDTAVMRSSDPAVIAHFRDAAAIDAGRDASHDAVDRNGVLLDYRWVVASDGTLQIGMSSCGGCHTRLMPDGSLLRGAPCNFDLADSAAADVMLAQLLPVPLPRGLRFYEDYGVPWVKDDVHLRFRDMADDAMREARNVEDGAPPGTTFARINGSPFYVTRMADLIGIKDRRYLDSTGTHRNRGPEDVARYGILVEFADSRVFGPHHMTATQDAVRVRPPDEAMVALARYVESLEYPSSPHPFDDSAKRGQGIFEDAGCGDCHTPPLYTNNMLVAVDGFEPDRSNPAAADLRILRRHVGTDPGLALKTRKGTGFYRVPTLRGLWYRGLYEHSGSIASLEEWFDRARLRDDYRPSGFRGPGVTHRAVPGHEFGLDLPADEKRDLIAFLSTL